MLNMTLQEYINQTEIASSQEAEDLLKNFQILITVSALFSLLNDIVTFMIGNALLVLVVGTMNVVVLTFFMLLTREIIRKTRKVTQAHWYFSFLFAPFSWFFFYPQITKPLKVLSGKASVPENEEMERIMKINASAKPFSRVFFVLIVILFVVATLFNALSYI